MNAQPPSSTTQAAQIGVGMFGLGLMFLGIVLCLIGCHTPAPSMPAMHAGEDPAHFQQPPVKSFAVILPPPPHFITISFLTERCDAGSYLLEASIDLAHWTPLTNIAPTGDEFSLKVACDLPAKFFRVQTILPK